jgi:two-component system sensor histidine kinase HydH
MPRFSQTLRSWLIPAVLAITATALTVPWSYWVIKAAYDRDIIENARSIAQRVQLRVALAPHNAIAQATDALATEISTDPTVITAFYYDLSSRQNAGRLLPPIGWTRQKSETGMTLQVPDVKLEPRAMADVLVEQRDNRYIIVVPWKSGPDVIGLTYLELSYPALRDAFWHKEGPLVKRVIAITAAAILVLSVVAIYAYGVRMKIAIVSERAELSQQGLVAERGLTAAVLAHEIRNPLAALRFQLHSLRKNALEADRVQNTADTIDAELSRIQQLVTDYLEHEKARSMRVQPVDLEQSARSLVKLLDELFNQTRTELKVIPAESRVIVTCDPHALRQVLINLALNAQQAMREGGVVTLKISRDPAEPFGIIDVADTGPGIPPDLLDRLFKPFQTTKEEGHGIGLALVKRFVDNFGGSITVDSEPGKGTTFHLRLPLAST